MDATVRADRHSCLRSYAPALGVETRHRASTLRAFEIIAIARRAFSGRIAVLAESSATSRTQHDSNAALPEYCLISLSPTPPCPSKPESCLGTVTRHSGRSRMCVTVAIAVCAKLLLSLLVVVVCRDLFPCAGRKRVRCGHLLCGLPAVCLANGRYRHHSHGPNRADQDREEDYRVLVRRILLRLRRDNRVRNEGQEGQYQSAWPCCIPARGAPIEDGCPWSKRTKPTRYRYVLRKGEKSEAILI